MYYKDARVIPLKKAVYGPKSLKNGKKKRLINRRSLKKRHILKGLSAGLNLFS